MHAKVVALMESAKARDVRLMQAVTSDNHEQRTREFDAFHEEARRIEEEKRQLARIEGLIKQVPMRFRYKGFHDYTTQCDDQIRIKNIALRYVMGFKDMLTTGTSLIFRGKPGTGKTLLSLVMYQELAKKGFNVRYESSLDFVGEMLIQKFKSDVSYQAQLRAFDFLVIDEATESINKGGVPSDIEKQVLFQIINRRYERQRCTIIISNRDHEDISDRLGMPLVDRLLEQGMTLSFDWNSYRQR